MGDVTERKLAVITGASSGIGFALAEEAVERKYDLVICAQNGGVEEAAADLRSKGASVHPVVADLATRRGVDHLVTSIQALARPVDALLLNAGVGVGGAFLDTSLDDELRMIALNVSSVVHLAKLILPAMVERRQGRVLITALVVSTAPGPYEAVYAATKAFDLSFAEALRVELADSGVTVTALQPGATDTNFFARAHLTNTRVGQSKKDDPAAVARMGFEAMLAGKASVVAASFKSKAMGAAHEILPEPIKARIHASQSRPRP